MNIEDFNRRIEKLSDLKDNAVKKADYNLASEIRNQLDAVKLEKRRVAQSPNSVALEYLDTIFKQIVDKKKTKAEEKRVMEDRVRPYAGLGKTETIPGWGSGCPPMTSSGHPLLRAEQALRNILEVTNPDAPGIYEAITVEKVNNLARRAIGIADAPRECWSHHQPVSNDAPKEIHWEPLSSRIVKDRIAEALDKLSGNLSHDNVAAAKQILKKILD